MNPGFLDRRILIQARTLTQDATGSDVETWANSAQVWARLQPSSGAEATAGDAERTQDRAKFTIRHRSINSLTHRLTHAGKTWNIVGISEVGGRQAYLELETVALQNAA